LATQQIAASRSARWALSVVAVRWLALGLMAVVVLLPLVPIVIWSFAFRWAFPDLLPATWSLRAWRYVAAPESQVAAAFQNSLALGLSVTALATLIGVPAGRALGLHEFRGKRLVEFLILAPVIVPGLAVVLGIHVLFIRYGLSETFLGVVLVHLVPTTPYMTLVMASVFANYDAQFEEQARVLGAGPWRAFALITLPAILPGVAVGALFAFLISWSQYILTLLIGGGAVITLPLLLFSFAGSGDNAIAGALSLLFAAPSVLLLVLTSRFLGGQSALGFGKL
jgi:putative spermidine/putrescine transport system permease protein